MKRALSNFGKVTASQGYNSLATTIQLQTGHGAKLPTTALYHSASNPAYPIVWWNNTDYADAADDPNVEVVWVYARVGDTLTILRGQEGTLASDKNLSGKTYRLALAFTKAIYDGFYDDHRRSCGRFDYNSSAVCLFKPFNGNTVVVNGKQETIPDGGVTFGTAGLAANTTYLAFLFHNGTHIDGEWQSLSSAPHSAGLGTGVEIKTGDASRTLVGMARTNASTQFSSWLVHSWFNRRPKTSRNGLSGLRSTLSGNLLEISQATERAEFLVWAGEEALIQLTGSMYNATAGQWIETVIGIDNLERQDGYARGHSSSANHEVSAACALRAQGLSEGYHDARVLGRVNGGTGNWVGGVNNPRLTIEVTVNG